MRLLTMRPFLLLVALLLSSSTLTASLTTEELEQEDAALLRRLLPQLTALRTTEGMAVASHAVSVIKALAPAQACEAGSASANPMLSNSGAKRRRNALETRQPGVLHVNDMPNMAQGGMPPLNGYPPPPPPPPRPPALPPQPHVHQPEAALPLHHASVQQPTAGTQHLQGGGASAAAHAGGPQRPPADASLTGGLAPVSVEEEARAQYGLEWDRMTAGAKFSAMDRLEAEREAAARRQLQESAAAAAAHAAAFKRKEDAAVENLLAPPPPKQLTEQEQEAAKEKMRAERAKRSADAERRAKEATEHEAARHEAIAKSRTQHGVRPSEATSAEVERLMTEAAAAMGSRNFKDAVALFEQCLTHEKNPECEGGLGVARVALGQELTKAAGAEGDGAAFGQT